MHLHMVASFSKCHKFQQLLYLSVLMTRFPGGQPQRPGQQDRGNAPGNQYAEDAEEDLYS